MKKVALVFVLAVFVPSVLLAWMAFRSVRDQEYVAERQRTLLVQAATDELARAIDDEIKAQQRLFGEAVEDMASERPLADVARDFDRHSSSSVAEIGFAVTTDGKLISPSLSSDPKARAFRLENELFLTSRETVEVYWESPKGPIDMKMTTKLDQGRVVVQKMGKVPSKAMGTARAPVEEKGEREVAEFRQLIGDSSEGTLARFHEDELRVLFWYRSPVDPDLVFGAQVALDRLVDELRDSIRVPVGLAGEIAIAMVDDSGSPRAVFPIDYVGSWKTAFASTDVGETLPHWQIAAYWLNADQLNKSASILKLMLGLLVVVLLLAIVAGGWLIVNDLNRQLELSRQKTDFVSNVSHELKTPLTSIRMFSELLAEGRVEGREKQQRFLNIITTETARLTRLINNVLDFAKMERGEKEYQFENFDLRDAVDETAQTYRLHLEEKGFDFRCRAPEQPLTVRGDRDALTQVVVNLLSNAEKYSGDHKDVGLELKPPVNGDAMAELQVLDRGLGVPRAWEEKIFEQFSRAHDSLSSGIEGSGLGLTLARKIARAHGGDLTYEPRDGGGSCFTLRLPLATSSRAGASSNGDNGKIS